MKTRLYRDVERLRLCITKALLMYDKLLMQTPSNPEKKRGNKLNQTNPIAINQ